MDSDTKLITMQASKEKIRELYDGLMAVKNGKVEESTVIFIEAQINIFRSDADTSIVLIEVRAT